MEKFKFTWDCWWDVNLEVDPTKIENFKEQLLFWSGGEYRIAKEKGDVKMAFLKMLVPHIIEMSISMSVQEICKEFEQKEGWLPLTIENGVRIADMDTWEFDEDDFFIAQLK